MMTLALLRRLTAATLAALAMTASACTITLPVYDSEERVNAVAYRTDGAPSLTLFTSINDETGIGEHSALLINGSQRVLYDPAGRFKHPMLAEQGDVLFGITPDVLEAYRQYQSEGDYTLVAQRIEVALEVADSAIDAARRQGRSSDGLCTVNNVEILRQVEGFEDIEFAIWPSSLMWDFARRSGIRVTRY